MNAILVLSESGIQASFEPPDGVRLKGLSKLQGEKKEEIIEFAKNHKFAIIGALADLPNPDLPATCPFNTGGYAPAGCRFSHDLLMSLIIADVMPDPDVGCILKHICGELPEKKDEAKPIPADERLVPAEPVETKIECSTCPAYDPNLDRCYGVAYFEHKAGPWRRGQEALKQCPR